MADDDLLIERLLRVIDEGRRVATYKLALLLGIVEAVALTPGADELPTRLIAERVVALYYPQTRAYVAADGIARELRQITASGSPVLRASLRLRLVGDNAGCRSADEARRAVPGEYERGVDQVEDTFVRYPIADLHRRRCTGGDRLDGLVHVHRYQRHPIARDRPPHRGMFQLQHRHRRLPPKPDPPASRCVERTHRLDA